MESESSRNFHSHVLLGQMILLNLTLTSLIVRILLSSIDGYYIDVGCFKSWFYAASEYGVQEFYQKVWCDYPPLNVYLFWVFGNLAKHLSLFGSPHLIYLIKLPSNLFDLATAYLIFNHLKRKMSQNYGLIGAVFYLFNPATIFNSSIWGQYDAIYTFFIVLSLIAILDLRVGLSLASYALAVLTKPQAVAFLPILTLFILCRCSLKDMVKAFCSFLATFMLVILPFKWSNPIDFLIRIYLGGYGEYKYTSLNAMNFWALVGINMQDTQQILPYVNYHVVGWILFGISTVFILGYMKVEDRESFSSSIVYATFLIFFSFFMFLTRMHERYLFPAVAFSLLSLTYSRKLLPISAVITATLFTNQVYALELLNEVKFIPPGDPLTYIISSLNLFTIIYCFYLFLKDKTFKEVKGL